MVRVCTLYNNVDDICTASRLFRLLTVICSLTFFCTTFKVVKSDVRLSRSTAACCPTRIDGFRTCR